MANNDGGSFFAFLLGGLIGAAAGVLFAPAEGEVTRRKIKAWAEEQADKGLEELEDMKEELEKTIEKKKKSATRKIKEIKKEFKDALDERRGE